VLAKWGKVLHLNPYTVFHDSLNECELKSEQAQSTKWRWQSCRSCKTERLCDSSAEAAAAAKRKGPTPAQKAATAAKRKGPNSSTESRHSCTALSGSNASCARRIDDEEDFEEEYEKVYHHALQSTRWTWVFLKNQITLRYPQLFLFVVLKNELLYALYTNVGGQRCCWIWGNNRWRRS